MSRDIDIDRTVELLHKMEGRTITKVKLIIQYGDVQHIQISFTEGNPIIINPSERVDVYEIKEENEQSDTE